MNKMTKGKFSVGNSGKFHDADFVVLPRRSKRRNFVMLDRDGLLQLCSMNISKIELKIILYLMAHREPKFGTIIPTTGRIIAADIGSTQCQVSIALTSLKKRGILIVDMDCTRDYLPVSGFVRWRIASYLATA